MSAHTDLGRWDEYREMNLSIAVPTIVLRDGEEKVVMAIPSRLSMENWNERYPDEMWAVYVRPSPKESGVRPVGMIPAFEIVLTVGDRFADEHIEEIHYGTYDEMHSILKTTQSENIILSKQFKEANA